MDTLPYNRAKSNAHGNDFLALYKGSQTNDISRIVRNGKVDIKQGFVQ